MQARLIPQVLVGAAIAALLSSSAARAGEARPTLASHCLEQDGAPRAWQQLVPYVPPSFESYFPDDEEGAAALDELIGRNALRDLPDEEFLQTVRRGLRRTTNHRTSILSWVGNRMVWGVEDQNADAIELCYHAADFSEQAARYGARHYAVYFGLSVVHEKTPAILRTLADLSVAVDDPNDIGRVAWGAATQIDGATSSGFSTPSTVGP